MKKASLILLGLGGFAALCALGSAAVSTPPPSAAKVDYDREVKPILSENCFACHGPDANKRMAGLRLDLGDSAKAKVASGKAAVVPGSLDGSELVHRITATGGLQMPPASSDKKLTAAQIATLKRWISQGAPYAQHWAFVPPRVPAIPAVMDVSWVRNPIDNFVLARLEKAGLKPSPEADRHTLIRRVTLDLTGLPPTPAEVEAFVNDTSPDAYEKVVDRLLASSAYGERMALAWLDLARYADTHGYHIDSQRDMWRWRDWVIDAYSKNMPYDEFVTEQLAGDLLPNATLEQKIATGFNRNHPINFEGGAIPEEYQAAYVEDRIDTTSTAFMGLTMRCGQCHDHKYDPITQKDYYRFYAFFNNIPENGLDGQTGNAAPFIKAPLPQQQAELDRLKQKVAELETAQKARAQAAAPALVEWEKAALASFGKTGALANGLSAQYSFDETSGDKITDAAGKQPAGTVQGKAAWAAGKLGGALSLDGMTYCELGNGFAFERTDKFSYGAWVNPATNEHHAVLSRMDGQGNIRGWDLYLGDGKVYAHLISEWEKNAVRVNTKAPIEMNKWTHLFVTYDGSSKAAGVKIYVNGKPAELERTHDTLTGTIRADKPVAVGRRTPSAPFKGLIDEVRIYSRELSANEVAQMVQEDSIRPIVATPAEKRTAEQRDTLAKYFLENHDEPYRKLAVDLAGWKAKYAELDKAIPTTMVMEEMPKPRETHILLRGQYDKKGEKVEPGVPAIFPPLPQAMPANRLALAKWLTSPQHPLTARVAVNRYWQMLFGAGLVRTAENFGTQGEEPTHPELLDWLATRFAGVLTADTHAKALRRKEGQQQIATEAQRHRGIYVSLTETSRKAGKGAKEQTQAAARSFPPDQGGTEGGAVETAHARTPEHLNTERRPWDIKALLRLIVTSATYRQSSKATPAMLAKDPENRLLARAPRFRLPAEVLRDQALALSGLLVNKVGGPSVKPYHPPRLWEELAFGAGFSAQTYVQDHGENLYRRSMYTFWKRTVPPPALQTFDAPEREFCIVRRSVTNTPLQALVLMNEPGFVEASRKFAERVIKESPADQRERIKFAFRMATTRVPKQAEIQALQDLAQERLAFYAKDRAAAEKLVSVGESPRDTKIDTAELAAWTAVVSAILNLDETITRG